jgi:hypothetical protein
MMIFIAGYWMVSLASAASLSIPIPDFSDPFAHPQAFIKYQWATYPNGGLVYFMDSYGTPQTQAYIDLPGAQNILQGFACHNRHLYAMVMIGKYPQWKREFWRYDGIKKKTKLFEGKISGSFLVSDDEAYIALCDTDGTEKGNKLTILNPSDGTVLKTFSANELELAKLDDFAPLNLISFYRGALWVCDGEAVEEPISHFIRLDVGTWKINVFPCDQNTRSSYGFNPLNHLLIYDDFPGFQDDDDYKSFKKTKTPVHLYVYDVESGKSDLIATGPAWEYKERWVGKNVFEYQDPTGHGVVQKRIDRLP